MTVQEKNSFGKNSTVIWVCQHCFLVSVAGAFPVAQRVKHLSIMQETRVQSSGQKNSPGEGNNHLTGPGEFPKKEQLSKCELYKARLHWVFLFDRSEVKLLSLTLCNPMVQTPQSMGFSRQEYWSGFAILFSRGSSQPKDRTRVSCNVGRRFTV